MPVPSWPLSRRQFLVGGTAAAGAALLASCGSADTASTTTTTASGSLSLVQFFGGPMFAPGRELRAPFGVADAHGLLPVDRTPKRLEVQLFRPDGTELDGPQTVDRHAEGLPRAYFPLLATVDEAGIYTARTRIDGVAAEMQIHVHEAGDLRVIQPGAPLPALETPTTADPHGVDPICTRDPICPLHELTVAEALTEGSPIALLVASPAFCHIKICGPVLEVLLPVRAEFPDVRFIHVEVYADPANGLETYAPAIEPLGLHFEPCLVLAGSDGSVADRVDTIYDQSELRDRLALLA